MAFKIRCVCIYPFLTEAFAKVFCDLSLALVHYEFYKKKQRYLFSISVKIT